MVCGQLSGELTEATMTRRCLNNKQYEWNTEQIWGQSREGAEQMRIKRLLLLVEAIWDTE